MYVYTYMFTGPPASRGLLLHLSLNTVALSEKLLGSMSFSKNYTIGPSVPNGSMSLYGIYLGLKVVPISLL